MELVFRPPYQARYGGLVERIFGNLSGQLRERLPGALLQPSQRQWHNASQGACLLYRDVARVVQQLVTDYLHTPHSELDGLTPHEKWLAGLQLMVPVPPPLTPHLERCFWRLHPETRLRNARRVGLVWPALLGSQAGRYPQPAIGKAVPGASTCATTRPTSAGVAVFEHGLWLGDALRARAEIARWPLRSDQPVGTEAGQGTGARAQSAAHAAPAILADPSA